jgi:hypothetical protein
MAIRLVKTETLLLTRELAIQFKSMQPLRGERQRKESRCKFFRAHLREGTFGSPFWKQCTIGDSDTMFRCDGQHTSWVLAELSEADFPQGLTVVIATYHLDSLADASPLFDMFDNPVSARSQEDRTGFYSSIHPELDGIPVAFLTKTAKIVGSYRQEMNSSLNDEGEWLRVYPARERGLYFEDRTACEFAVWLYRFNNAMNSWILRLDTDLLAALVYQWTKSPHEATELWSDVFSSSSADPSSVSVELRDILREMRKTPSQKKRLAKVRRAIDRLWDAYLRSDKRESIPIPSTLFTETTQPAA